MERNYENVKDLKAFLLRGNVVDLAVGVIIATAFGAIVTSLVNDIITPLILNPALEAAKVQNIAELAWNGVTYGKILERCYQLPSYRYCSLTL